MILLGDGQHGLLCTLMALLRAGDTLVTEQLTYPGLISAARMLGISRGLVRQRLHRARLGLRGALQDFALSRSSS